MISFSVLFLVIQPVASVAQSPPERDLFGTEADALRVTLYMDPNYKNPIGSWELQSGMRMLRIPQIAQRPWSIFLGSKVAAYLFPDVNFASRSHRVGNYYHAAGSTPGGTHWHLVAYNEFLNSTPWISGLPPSHGYSLVLHRKDVQDILGVYLESGDPTTTACTGQFHHLPDRADQTAIAHKKLPWGGPFELQVIAGGTHQLGWSAKGGAHPSANDIEITVDFANGSSKKLPEASAGPPAVSWDLDQYSKGQQISSLRLRYTGPFDISHYLRQDPSRHRAPPAPEQPPPPAQLNQPLMIHAEKLEPEPGQIVTKGLEIGFDRPGGDYTSFDLSEARPELCRDACLKDGRCRAFTYVKPGIQGSKARCWLKEVASPARPGNGMVSGVKP